MNKYRVGDKVLVVKYRDDEYFNDDGGMDCYLNTIVTIKTYDEDESGWGDYDMPYTIEEDVWSRWTWCDCMFVCKIKTNERK